MEIGCLFVPTGFITAQSGIDKNSPTLIGKEDVGWGPLYA